MCIDITDAKYDYLAELAAKPDKARRCHELAGYPLQEYSAMPNSYRNIFMSDRDRILYCKSFLRLSGKTQVYSPSTSDHQRTRLTHTLEVSQIARTISQALRLNCDLTEAIALGHDIGHTPFGHAGEEILHEIMSPKNENNHNAPKRTTIYNLDGNEIDTYKPLYGFKHNLQSVRCLVEDLESRRNLYGLNLTNYTLWGIMHHSSLVYKEGKVKTEYLIPYFYEKYENYCNNQLQSPAWTFEALVVAEADEIAQMHHDLEDAIRKKAMTKEKVIEILLKLSPLMCKTDLDTLKDIEKQKWVPREYLISKTSKIIVNTLVTALISASAENLYTLITRNLTSEDNDEDKIKNKIKTEAEKILRRSYNDLEIANAIQYDVYSSNAEQPNKDIIRDFQDKIATAVINTFDVQRSDSKGQYIIKNLFEAYYTNPQQLPDSALKNLYKILKEDNYLFKLDVPAEDKTANTKDFFDIESDMLRAIINKAVEDIRDNNNLDKRRDILIMRIICDYISGMTDSFAINEYEKLYG